MFAAHPLLRRLVVSLLIGLAASPAWANNDAELNRLFGEARALYQAGNVARAIELYESILKAAPEAENVLVAYAEAKFRQGDKEGALQALTQVFNSFADHAGALRVRARILYQEKDYAGSLASIDRAIRSDPASVWAHTLRADIHVALNKTDEALADLSRAIEIDPERATLFRLRAELHARRGDHSFARADYSRTIQLDPNDVEAFLGRGWFHFVRHEWTEALGDARRAVELAPKLASAHRIAGYALYAQADYVAAEQALAEAIRLDENAKQRAYPMFARHLLLGRLKKPDDRQVANAVAQWQDHAWLQAIGRFISGEIDENAFEKAARDGQMPGSPSGRLCEMHYYIGMVRLTAGDLSTARLRFQSSLATGEKRFVQYILAEVELKRL